MFATSQELVFDGNNIKDPDSAYSQTSGIRHTKSPHLNITRLADRRCSNYIWIISDFIAYKGATYIIGLKVVCVQIKLHE